MIIGGTGSGSFNLIKDKSISDLPFQSKYLEINLNPNISYFFIDNLALGLSATTGLALQEDNNGYILGIGPEIKYYFNNGIFLRSDFSYQYGHTESSKSNLSVVKAGIGYAFFLSSKLSLEPTLLYKYSSQNLKAFDKVIYGIPIPGPAYNQKWNSFTFEIGLNIFL